MNPLTYTDIGREHLGSRIVFDDEENPMHLGDWVEVTRGLYSYPEGNIRIGRKYQIVKDDEDNSKVVLKNSDYKDKYEGVISATWYLVRCKVIKCAHNIDSNPIK